MFVVVLSLLTGCKKGVDTDSDTDVPVEQPAPEGFLTGDFCLVRTVFEVSCVTGCHSGVVQGGGLDLQTNPHAAIVNRPSAAGAGTLVAPGSPTESFLYRKMVNLIAEGEGGVMPPDGPLELFATDLVRTWIENGAVNDCNIPPPGDDPAPPPPPPPPEPDPNEDPNAPYHPPNWAQPDNHGVAANLQTDGDCRSCHGANLDGVGGNTTVSCDQCHDPGWRTDCTFCHGGTVNASGAPPKDIDGQDDPQAISFTAHTAHIDEEFGCEQCHYKPSDVLSNGHIFGDVTPGYGEIDYTAGYSPIATYNAATGTCSNAYCHGSGRADDGTVTDGDGPLGCTSCHPNAGDPNGWAAMSGRHQLHLQNAGASCYQCHANTVDANNGIIGPQYHVNRQKDVFSNELQAGATCNGTCHGHGHENDVW